MLATAVISAFAAVVLPVMIALHIRIVGKLISKQRFHRRIRVAGYPSVEFDPRGSQRILGSAADAAADQDLHLVLLKEAGQCSVSAAVRIHHLRRDDLIVLHLVDFELLRVSKMLKNLDRKSVV